jgi:TetR/AcrR family transcriptional regulator, repressor for neighboring sulfatase
MSENEEPASPRRRKAIERALIDAAIQLFAERGIRAVSVRAIASLANVNHGLVHHYFGSKSGLVKAALDDLAQRLGPLVGQVGAAGDGRSFVENDAQARIHVRVLAYAILEDEAGEFQASFPIIERFTALAEQLFGLDNETARLRSVQAAAMIFGWMMMEPWLLNAGGFEPERAKDLRPRLAEGIARLAARDAPTPTSPAPPGPTATHAG